MASRAELPTGIGVGFKLMYLLDPDVVPDVAHVCGTLP
jgi:hypothetical protein